MTYTKMLQPLCVANEMPPPYTVLYTAGWPGKRGGAKKTTKIISEEVMKLRGDLNCRQTFFGKIEDDQRCAELPFVAGESKTPCSRDVGAPVVMVDEDGRPKLVGIMTNHRHCIKGEAIFTDVLYHKEWIDAVAFNQPTPAALESSPKDHNRLFDAVLDYQCESAVDQATNYQSQGSKFLARII